MSLKAWLVLLPTVLLALLATTVAVLVVQSMRGTTLLERANERLTQRQAINAAAEACGGITQRAIVWTMTRRTSEQRAYTENKQNCQERLQALMGLGDSEHQQRVQSVASQFSQLTALLETIQAEYEDEARMRTFGRLEREVKPIAAAIADELAAQVEREDASSQAAVADLSAQQRRSATAALAAGLFGLSVVC